MFRTAMDVPAVFICSFQLQCGMTDPVVFQFMADGLLDKGRLPVCDDVHGCVICVSVHAPYVDMVYVDHACNGTKMFSDMLHVDALGCFFEEKGKCLL